ncbi:MAG: hypothetical protein KGJ23_10500 [Euryarchaeota archaeon]|nr:hypothetical protein [Euryarchaeota archaeon]MDE1879885.1 hypothetical protein [Euryarchaeota archaeon]MDE2045693.1 hypothetical protein [Thermoplasmata archaeon]
MTVIDAFPLPTPYLAAYAAVAAGMVAFNIWVFLQFFPRKGGTPTLSHAILVAFLLFSSLVLWITVLYDVLSGDTSVGFTAALFGIQIMMTAPFVWAFVTILRGHERRVETGSWAWAIFLGLIMLGNELLMGAVYTLALGTPISLNGPNGLLNGFAYSAGSVWFFWAMFTNMVLLLCWVPLPREERLPLLGLAASALVGPWVVSSPVLGSVLMAVVMTGTFIVLFEELGRRPAVSSSHLGLVLGVSFAFLVMTVGELWLLAHPSDPWGPVPFQVGMLVVMLAEMSYVAHRLLGRPTSGPVEAEPTVLWIERPAATTAFLALGFASEWAMAATLSLAFFGPSWHLPSASGGIGAVLVSGLLFVAQVTAGPFFLGIMGVEMGALVAVRLRRVAQRETRNRLTFALGAYGLYTVLGPALVRGWSEAPTWPNVGAFGGVGPATVIALGASYATLGVLALLFGRRAYCSTLCPSAVMYGGTFSQRLIPTIAERPWPRHQVLGGGWKGIPRALAIGAWALMGVVVAVSAFDEFAGGHITLSGADVSVVYAAAVWDVLWYGFFIAIPYVGMSPCRSWGFCSTGTFLGVVSRLGAFHKEALDPAVCRTCPTHDCGKACEVGLVEMPVVLAKTGQYRSTKCVGSSDCEMACPYGNLVTRDVRDILRRRLGLPDRFQERLGPHARPVPMARPTTTSLETSDRPPA